MTETVNDHISVETAGRMAGISPRTLRSWIVHGRLPAVGGLRGKLVRLDDVLMVAREQNGDATPLTISEPPSDIGNSNGNGTGNGIAHLNGDSQPNHIVDSMLAELRDGVLWPLAERLEVLARENGRLVAERDAALNAQKALTGQLDSDHRFLDQLVELLQVQLDEAQAKIAALELENTRLSSELRLAISSTSGIPRRWWRVWEPR